MVLKAIRLYKGKTLNILVFDGSGNIPDQFRMVSRSANCPQNAILGPIVQGEYSTYLTINCVKRNANCNIHIYENSEMLQGFLIEIDSSSFFRFMKHLTGGAVA